MRSAWALSLALVPTATSPSSADRRAATGRQTTPARRANAREVSSQRVAVMVLDPEGHGTRLAEAVAAELARKGIDAVAVAPPAELTPEQEDEAARVAGAERIVALEVRTELNERDYTARNEDVLRPGTPEHPYDPNVRVGPFLMGPVMAPIVPPDASQEEQVTLLPQLPYAAISPDVDTRVAVRSQAHVTARRVGEARPTVDTVIDQGAMTSYREDLQPRGSVDREVAIARMWKGLFQEIAQRTAKLIPLVAS
jgi:hypothetical protein